MLDSLTRVPLPPQQDGVGTSGCAHSELVEGKDLTTSLEDALLGGRREPEGGDGEFWQFGETDIIGNGADNDDRLRFKVDGVCGLLRDA